MLAAFLIKLSALAPADPPVIYGNQARGWFLHWLEEQSPELSKALHDWEKCYTVSTLLDETGCPLPVDRPIQKGQTFWIRVTSFNDDPTRALINILDQLPPEVPLVDPVEHHALMCKREGSPLQPGGHPWAGMTTFADIVSSAENVYRSRQVQLDFVSPTTFANGKADVPLPLPSSVFSSLWKKWNENAPEKYKIDKEWYLFCKDCIVISEIQNLNALRWRGAENMPRVGFTGRVHYTLLPKDHVGDWASYWEGADQVMQTLANFAFYCGVGHETEVGMGQVRLIPILKTMG